MSISSARPAASEYAPNHEKYVSLVADGDIVNTLTAQGAAMSELLRGIPEARADSRYAPGKWSIKEVVGHVNDFERIFAYRALRFARNDPSPQGSFDHVGYVQHASFGELTLADLATEFEHVRSATVWLFKCLAENAWTRTGIASGAELSVRGLAYVIAGHELHHVNILKARYL